MILISFLFIASHFANTISEKYGENFNKVRSHYNLSPIMQDWEFQTENWDNFIEPLYTYDSNTDNFVRKHSDLKEFIHRWSVILRYSFSEYDGIILTNSYKNSEKNLNEPFLFKKSISYLTNICFWKNKIISEIDEYKKYSNDQHYERLEIEYYFNGLNYHSDKYDTSYFVFNYYPIDTNKMYICGNEYLEDSMVDIDNMIESYYNGNISKSQADSILIDWKIKKNGR